MPARRYEVIKVGTDSSGRTIYLTRYMARWIKRLERRCGFPLVITQGAFMTRTGGGATASAGYHDLAGCVDFRTRDISAVRKRLLVRHARELGGGLWIRDLTHGGMEEHAHVVLGTDRPLAAGAVIQWQEYLNGGDGLVGGDSDYHWRPDPIVTVPPPLNRSELIWLATEAIKAGRLVAAIRRLRQARALP
jgi:hypothetical protein